MNFNVFATRIAPLLGIAIFKNLRAVSRSWLEVVDGALHLRRLLLPAGGPLSLNEGLCGLAYTNFEVCCLLRRVLAGTVWAVEDKAASELGEFCARALARDDKHKQALFETLVGDTDLADRKMVLAKLLPHLNLALGAGPDWKFTYACGCGNLAAAQWLTAAFGIAAADARAADNSALRRACGNGHLHVVQWLVAEFGLTAADAHARENSALYAACVGGHLHVAVWLTAKFDYTTSDARACSCCALLIACESGHLAVAQWLAAAFGLAAADARAASNYALGRACANGHLAVAQWLVAAFGLAAADARAAGNYALGRACAGGHLAVAQWLVATFGLAASDARASRELWAAAAGGQPAVTQWLVTALGLTAEEARGKATRPRRASQPPGLARRSIVVETRRRANFPAS
jgi:hypothetical protein